MILFNYKQANSAWEIVLPEVLHSVRSLLCTVTNATPHKRFLKFDRRSMLGRSLPHWLVQPGTVLLRRFIRNKNQPRVDTVELIEANSNFAHIRFPDGRESTVSVSDLAPMVSRHNLPQMLIPIPCLKLPNQKLYYPKQSHQNVEQLQIKPDCSDERSKHLATEIQHAPPTLTCRKQSRLCTEPLVSNDNSGVELRCSSRTSKPPKRYGQNIYDQDCNNA